MEKIKDLELKPDFPLCSLSKFKSGGRALLCVAHSESALADTVRQWYRTGQDFLVLGAGSNILISDRGVNLPVLKLGEEFAYIREQGPENITAGAAAGLSILLNFCIKCGFSGLEPLCGIPASIGGMAVMNASSFGREISSLIDKVKVLDRQACFKEIEGKDIDTSYRQSSLQSDIVTEVVFSLEKRSGVKERAKEYFNRRCSAQDYQYPSLGCIFRNPKDMSAGRLIEDCGLKGFSVGDAFVSLKHANFIINKGNALSDDVLELIRVIKEKVREKYGVLLEEEIKIW